MNSHYELGQIIKGKNQNLRVVRIVKSQTLFEPPEGDLYILNEHYLELRNAKSEVSFIRLASERSVYNGAAHLIKGVPPIYSREEETYGEVNTPGSENPSEG